MNDQLVKNIETIVDEIFKKKEEAEMRKETEVALTTAAETITQLNESLEAKDVAHEAEVASLQETITSLESQLNEIAESKKTLEDEKAGFDKEKEELTKRAEAAEAELVNMKKDQLSKDRMEVLRTAGVASKNAEAQQGKVREMSEEDFAAYRDELVSVRESIMAQLKASETNAEEEASTAQTETPDTTQTTTSEEASNEEASEEEAAIETEESIDPMRAVAAALNMEVTPNEDMIAKYRKLGAAMAENIKSKKDKK